MQESWYVIHSKPRQETRAEENLSAQGYQVYLPMLKTSKRRSGKWVEVVEPLFPRYLFIQMVENQDSFAPIRSTFGVSKLVRFGDTPAQAPLGLVESLRTLESSSDGTHIESDNLFEAGAQVDIVEGPLEGLKAIVKSDSGDERVILLLNLMGRENTTAVSRDTLIPSTS